MYTSLNLVLAICQATLLKALRGSESPLDHTRHSLFLLLIVNIMENVAAPCNHDMPSKYCTAMYDVRGLPGVEYP